MPKLNQKGFVQVVFLIILLAGLAAGIYLVGQTQIFKPKASLGANISIVDSSGSPIASTSSATVLVKAISPEWIQPTLSPTSTITPTPTPTTSPSPTPTPYGKKPPCGNYGDVNQDGVVTNADAALVRLIVNGKVSPTAEQRVRADVNGKGGITSVDALYIRRYVSGVDKTFPVCPKPTKKSGVLGESTSFAVVTATVVLAEDPNFTSNVKTVNFTTNPIEYIFSSSTAGTKTLYAKFIASDGQQQNANPFPVTINLVALTPSPTPSPVISSRVFVTSTTYNGNLGGLTGADAKCQTRANTANLGGTWKAWLSDGTTSAASRLTYNSGPYKLLNGVVVANDWADLTDGTLQNGINITELNTTPNYRSCVWTSTDINGNFIPNTANINACSDYTKANTDYSMCGMNGMTDYNWTKWDGKDRCDQLHPLYCFEQ